MPIAALNGVDLYYESHGKGPAIVLAHGASGNHLSWWQQVPILSRNHTCITFDHRGFGKSLSTSHEGMDAFPGDLRGLLKHLGIRRVVLVGQSFGGWTCLALTLQF